MKPSTLPTHLWPLPRRGPPSWRATVKNQALTVRIHALVLTSFAALLALVVGGCEDRKVGVVGEDGGVHDHDSTVDAYSSGDSGWTLDADITSDGGLQVEDLVGWTSVGFEHEGFIVQGDVDPFSLGSCNAYIAPLPGKEMWWMMANPQPDQRSLYPNVDGYEAMGLIRASGTIGPLGQYGHMGAYDREFHLTESELLVCESVAQAATHCLLPELEDLCVVGAPLEPTSRRAELIRVLPGPAGQPVYYELTVYDDENIADGETRHYAQFCLPPSSPDTAWEAFDLQRLQECGMVTLHQERLWFGHETLNYNQNVQGWVVRNAPLDRMKISLSGENPTEGALHIWLDRVVDEEIASP